MKKLLLASALVAAALPTVAHAASPADVVKRINYPTYTLSCQVMHSGTKTYFFVQNRVVLRIPPGHTITITYRMRGGFFRPPQTTTVVTHAAVPRYGRIMFAGIYGARTCGATVKMHPLAGSL